MSLAQLLQAQQKQWQLNEFNRGKRDGLCGYPNQNEGHMAPSPIYHAGYVCGIHKHLLDQHNIRPQDWEKWELLAEVRDSRFPLSSPIKFSLVAKTAGQLNAQSPAS